MKATDDFFEVSLNQLEQMTGFVYRTLKRKLKAAGCKPLRREGRGYIYDSPEALKAIYFSPETGEKKKLDAGQEMAKLTRERRKKTKVERLKLEKTLVDTSEIKTAYKNMVFGFREKMLAIPPKLCSPILTAKTKVEAQAMIKEEIETALIELVTDDKLLDAIVGDE